jgi:YHS domain-containing protein
MNRCITCSSIVTDPDTDNIVDYEGSEYYVCCPLCKNEFNQNPGYFAAILRVALGDRVSDCNNAQYPSAHAVPESSAESMLPLGNLHMLKSLETNFQGIREHFEELDKHFGQFSEAGGLEGLRNAMWEHRQMMDALRYEIAVFAGTCKFINSVSQSSAVSRA